GQANTAPPRSVMNSRRRMCPPKNTLVQYLKPSTLRQGGEGEFAPNRPSDPCPPCAGHVRSARISRNFRARSHFAFGARSRHSLPGLGPQVSLWRQRVEQEFGLL